MSKKGKNSNYKQPNLELQAQQEAEKKKTTTILIAMAALLLASVIAIVALGVNLAGSRSEQQRLLHELNQAYTQINTWQTRAENLQQEVSGLQMAADLGPNPVVTIEMEGGGVIKLELYPDKAPNTVKNFVYLVNQGFYDGLIYHRVSALMGGGEGLIIQGGCPQGSGMGNPGYSIFGEFADNGFGQNDISHLPGVISMARSQDHNSAGSQFFICAGAPIFLDRQYAAFGMVIEGMDVVDAIATTQTVSDRPVQDQIMRRVTVETFGVDWGEPDKLPGR
jgi:peptidyl-prolyl cis-trans isomerase B (cyclophilin B)